MLRAVVHVASSCRTVGKILPPRSMARITGLVSLDRLEILVRNRLKHLQYRPHTLDGFIAGTGLILGDPAAP